MNLLVVAHHCYHRQIGFQQHRRPTTRANTKRRIIVLYLLLYWLSAVSVCRRLSVCLSVNFSGRRSSRLRRFNAARHSRLCNHPFTVWSQSHSPHYATPLRRCFAWLHSISFLPRANTVTLSSFRHINMSCYLLIYLQFQYCFRLLTYDRVALSCLSFEHWSFGFCWRVLIII